MKQGAFFLVLAVFALSACAGGGTGGAAGGTTLVPSNSLGSSSTTLAKRYSLIDLGVNVRPAAVNASNTVVGTVGPAGGSTTAFRFQNGHLTTLAGLEATDINDSGLAVGDNGTEGLAFQANGSVVNLGALANTYAQGLVINNSGKILGLSVLSGIANCAGTLTLFSLSGPPASLNVTARQVALNSAGTAAIAQYEQFDPGCQSFSVAPLYYPMMTAIPVPSQLSLNANAFAITDMNDRGDVIGYSGTSGFGEASFYTHNAAALEITVPAGDDVMQANGINNAGWIVGLMGNVQSSAQPHAFAWIAGTVTDLNTLLPTTCAGWVLNSASDVSNAGVIVGTATVNGTSHGFMLVPSP